MCDGMRGGPEDVYWVADAPASFFSDPVFLEADLAREVVYNAISNQPSQTNRASSFHIRNVHDISKISDGLVYLTPEIRVTQLEL